jgi:thioredoxin-dependent peroxiredoxin
VIAPSGQIVHAYSKLDPTEHVSQTLDAVKTLKAKK